MRASDRHLRMTAELGFRSEGPSGAPAVVLSHALGTTTEMWDSQAAALRRAGLRVVRYDHRGHGVSAVPPAPYEIADLAEDLIDLMNRLEIPQAHLVGTSLGGMVALWAAAKFSDRIDHLVVCCTSPYLPPAEGWLQRAATVRDHGMLAVADAVLERWVTPQFAQRRPSVISWLREMLISTPAEGYAACCEAIARMDLRSILHEIHAPTLVIAAEHDLATPREHGERIRCGVAGSELAIVADAAHQAPVEQPAAISRLIVRHLTD